MKAGDTRTPRGALTKQILHIGWAGVGDDGGYSVSL
jgi:hypothetical protein